MDTSKQPSSESADKKQIEKKKNTRIVWDAIKDDMLIQILRDGITIDNIARNITLLNSPS